MEGRRPKGAADPASEYERYVEELKLGNAMNLARIAGIAAKATTQGPASTGGVAETEERSAHSAAPMTGHERQHCGRHPAKQRLAPVVDEDDAEPGHASAGAAAPDAKAQGRTLRLVWDAERSPQDVLLEGDRGPHSEPSPSRSWISAGTPAIVSTSQSRSGSGITGAAPAARGGRPCYR